MNFVLNFFIPFRLFSTNSFAKTIEDSALGYRLQGKSFLLTYSQVKDTNLESFSQDLIKKLNSSFDVDSLTVTCEFHQDKGRHFHAVVSFKKRIHTRDPKLFDIKEFHPNIGIARTPKKALEYILKDIAPGSIPTKDVLFSTFDIAEISPLFGVHNKKTKPDKKASVNATALAVYSELVSNDNASVLTAIDKLMKSDPVNTLKNYQKLFVNLIFIKSQHADYSASYVGFFKFDLIFAYGIHGWLMQEIKTHVLCIMGPTRCGKSSLALQITGKHPLVINEINGLVRLIPGHHTSIVFNDFDFEDLGKPKLSQYLALFDSKQPSSLRILFQSIHIPAYVPKIITSNNDLSLLFSAFPALHARHVFVHTSQALQIPEDDNYEFNLNQKFIGVPCAYDNNGVLLKNKHFCITSVAIFSYVRYIRKIFALERNMVLFLTIYPFVADLTEIQIMLLKSLDSMYYELRMRMREHYSFFHIYHLLQFYQVQHRNNFDFGKFIFFCEPIYYHYNILTQTPKKTYKINIFDIIYESGPKESFSYDFTKVNSSVPSKYDPVEDFSALNSYVPDPVFSSYVNEKDKERKLKNKRIVIKKPYVPGTEVPVINKVIDVNSINRTSADLLAEVLPSNEKQIVVHNEISQNAKVALNED